MVTGMPVFLLKKGKKCRIQSWVTRIQTRSVKCHFLYDMRMANVIPVVRKGIKGK